VLIQITGPRAREVAKNTLEGWRKGVLKQFIAETSKEKEPSEVLKNLFRMLNMPAPDRLDKEAYISSALDSIIDYNVKCLPTKEDFENYHGEG
jgi:hypothetical protein